MKLKTSWNTRNEDKVINSLSNGKDIQYQKPPGNLNQPSLLMDTSLKPTKTDINYRNSIKTPSPHIHNMSFILKTVHSFKSLTNLCSQRKKEKFIEETPKLVENSPITQGPIWYWENDINQEFPMTYYTPEVFDPHNYSIEEQLALFHFSNLPLKAFSPTLFYK